MKLMLKIAILSFLATSPIYAGITGKILYIDFQPNGDLVVDVSADTTIQNSVTPTSCANSTTYILPALDNPTMRQKAYFDNTRAALLAAFASGSKIQIINGSGCIGRSTDGAPFAPISRFGLSK